MNYTIQIRSQGEGEGGLRDLKGQNLPKTENMPFNAIL